MTRESAASDHLLARGSNACGTALLGLAVAVLGINDHLLKGAGVLPGAVTGKLSDFAGLIVASVLVALALRRLRVAPGLAAWIGCGSAGVGLTLLKLSDAVAAAYDAGLTRVAVALGGGAVAHTTVDPTDLFALVVLPMAFVLGHRLSLRGLPSRALIMAACMFCMGTSFSEFQVAPHWGFATPAGRRELIPGSFGLLDLQIGKVSGEGSFELGIAAHASAEPIAVELSQISGWLRRDFVRAGQQPGEPAVLFVPAYSAATARVHFIVRGFEVERWMQFDDVPTAVGFITIPVRIGERRQFIRPELSFESRVVSRYEAGRFKGSFSDRQPWSSPWQDHR